MRDAALRAREHEIAALAIIDAIEMWRLSKGHLEGLRATYLERAIAGYLEGEFGDAVEWSVRGRLPAGLID